MFLFICFTSLTYTSYLIFLIIYCLLVWAEQNPDITVQKAQRRDKVTVWCGMTASRMVGPFILTDTMNAERYLDLLKMTFSQSYPPGLSCHNIVFMQEDVPPHYATVVRNWLDRHFKGRWLCCTGCQLGVLISYPVTFSFWVM